MTKTVRALIQKFEKAINHILQWFDDPCMMWVVFRKNL